MIQSNEHSSTANRSEMSSSSSTQRFANFVRDQVGTLGTIFSSTPILSDYANLIDAPDRGVGLLTSIFCAAIFFGVFWARHQLVNVFQQIKITVISFFLVGLGSALLIHYRELSFFIKDKEPPTSAEEFHIGIILLYVGGFALILGGMSLIFVQGYAREEERELILNQALAEMTPEQWHFLQRLFVLLHVITQISNNKFIPQEARNALKDTAEHFYKYALGIFGEVDKYEIIVPGPGPLMRQLYNKFSTQAARYRALSYDDLEFWLDKEGSSYYLEQEIRLEQGQQVERIFIFPERVCHKILNDSDQKEKFKKVIDAQIARNIKVYVAILEKIPLWTIPGNKLDFGIFDLKESRNKEIYKPFAISYWRGERGPISREFKITIDPNECQSCNDYYNLVKEHCIQVNEKDKADRIRIYGDEGFQRLVKEMESITKPI